MAEQNANHSDSLHPLVNMSIIGFVLMFVAAMWMFFDSDPYGAWLDVVVTGLFIIAIAIPALLWLTWRRNADGARDDSHPRACSAPIESGGFSWGRGWERLSALIRFWEARRCQRPILGRCGSE